MIKAKSCYRKILHLDLDAFFCAVEEKLNSDLRGKAFAVGGSPEGRGVVTSCSYAARQFGIRSAMPMKKALSIYPKLIIAHSHYEQYGKYSHLVMDILRNLTPLVEQISIDEAFLDVSDLPHSPREIAFNLQKKIFEELSLPCSIGIATNKLMAKIATNIGKGRHKGSTAPMAICEVQPGEEESFLAPLSVSEMWGIGPKVTVQLQKLGICTIGDIVRLSPDLLVKNIGKFGLTLAQYARGIDKRPVMEGSDLKSISNEITFFKDIADENELIKTIKNLSMKVGQRLRKRNMSGFTIRLKIRWSNFETHTRQLTVEQPTDQDPIIEAVAQKLFYQIWKKEMKVRLIGVGVSQLTKSFQQLSLLDRSFEKEQRLLIAVDNLHQRFGNDIIHRGSVISYKRNMNSDN